MFTFYLSYIYVSCDCKGTLFIWNKHRRKLFFVFFYVMIIEKYRFSKKNPQKVWRIQKNSVPLHSHLRNHLQASRVKLRKLGYGVMVTLQILVLPFLVRVRIPQQRKPRVI